MDVGTSAHSEPSAFTEALIKDARSQDAALQGLQTSLLARVRSYEGFRMHETPMAATSPRPVPQVLQQMDGLGNLSERVTEAAYELERRLASILQPEVEVSPSKNCADSRDGQVLLAAALIEHNATLHRALGKLESILSRIEV